MPFDENLRPDVRSVLEASALLDITEYDLFHLAYARWHGRSADEDTMEPYFVDYMFREAVPLWVRHFSRLVERLYRMGRLDREALGVERLRGSRKMVHRGVRYAVTIALVLSALIVVARFMAEFLDIGSRCLFPPCY